MKHSRRLLILFFLFLTSASAQPSIEIVQMLVNYPQVTITFRVLCNGKYITVTTSDYTVTENGKIVKQGKLNCYEQPADTCMSYVLVFDRSGSMVSDKLINAKKDGINFINHLNQSVAACDEAEVISFGADISIDCPTTSDKTKLINAIDGLILDGATAIFDAIGIGIDEIIAFGKNSCRGLILFSDGGFRSNVRNWRFKTADAVVNYANQKGVNLYTVGYDSFGSDYAMMTYLASSTGGQYYSTHNNNDLSQLYYEIKKSAGDSCRREAHDDCIVSYDSDCPDGTLRTVEFTVKDVCGGTAKATVTYVAPLDRSKFMKVHLRLGNVIANASDTVLVPVILDTPVNGVFTGCSFTVTYDTSNVQLMGITTKGALLENTSVSMQDLGNGVRINILENTVLSGKGVLMYLKFRAGEPLLNVKVPMTFSHWDMDTDCLEPVLENGSLEITAKKPRITCDLLLPDSLIWDKVKNVYDPAIFSATVIVRNSGAREARNVRAHIEFNSPVLSLIAPLLPDQKLSPTDIYPNQSGSATWIVSALETPRPLSLTVLITVTADNYEPIQCTKTLRIPATVSHELTCSLSLPDSVLLDEGMREDTISLFSTTITVTNSGTLDAKNLHAHIQLNSPSFTLVAPTFFDQSLSPSDLGPGFTGTASWTIAVSQAGKFDTSSISVTVTSDNHVPITCSKEFYINPALSNALVCSLSAPDTIYFREQYYEPEQFDITLRARNTGTGQTRDVKGQLLQDTRFTILSPALLDLASTLAANAEAGGTFRVRMHPRQTDGFDTVRVNVQGSDSDPAWCEHPIWVQRERSPKFSLVCTTTDDSLAYSDVSNDYVPNPFEVTTVGTNIGETYAEDCQLMFVGPPRFAPIGTNLVPEGTMQVNDTRTEKWRIRALPRLTAGWDTLVFQILGKGGLGKKIVIGECQLPMYVPKVCGPAYEAVCATVDSLRFLNGGYDPDPFVFSTTIKNTGTATGRNLNPTIMLPSGITLAAGETVSRRIPLLAPGDFSTVSWKLHANARSTDGLAHICAQVTDSLSLTAECCTDVFVPHILAPAIGLTCSAPDTIYIEPGTSRYLGNPFTISLSVTNTGGGTAQNVRVRLIPRDSYVSLLDSAIRAADNLAPGAFVNFTWRVLAQSRGMSSSVPFSFDVSADNHALQSCTASTYIPSFPAPALNIQCASTPGDSLLFDWNTGDFNPKEGTVTAVVSNTGAMRAEAVKVLFVAPAGILLGTGETTLKDLQPANLEPLGSGTVSWKFRALRQSAGTQCTFTFNARADNAGEVSCTDGLFVQGAPKSAELSIPENLLYRFGQKGMVPVYIDKTTGKDLTNYSFELYFDPEIVSLLNVSTFGSLTELGWVGAVMRPLSSGRVRISDYTTSAPLHTEAGVLLYLNVEGAYNKNPHTGGFAQSPLSIDESTASLNNGDIQTSTKDGSIIVTNECLEPLYTNNAALLEQNRPNPFNPETEIAFTLTESGFVRLTVFDPMGREVEKLVNGWAEKGRHTVRFLCSRCTSGLYFYRLETSRQTEVKKMILAQ